MELDENLVRLQGALNSFTLRTSDLEKLQILSSIFENVSETAKMKMVFFLILNTKMKDIEPLRNGKVVDNVLSMCDRLDFPALSYLIFNLELVSSLRGIVSNGPAALTVQILNGVFAYADSRIKIRGLEEVIIAVFEKILKISRGLHNDFGSTSDLWEIMNNFGDMIWCRGTFENEDLVEEDMNKILKTCLDCVNLFNGDTPLSVNEAYEMGCLYFKSNIDEFDEIQEPDCKVKFEKYINKLLYLFYDVFNSSILYGPCEEELRDVCETAYILYDILENSELKPNNITYLNDIKKKPETELEKIARADIETIIYTLSSEKSSKNWFKALVNFPDVGQNDEALACIIRCLDMADPQDLMSIAALVQEQFKKTLTSNILLKLYFHSLSRMPLIDQLFHFENHFKIRDRPNLENAEFDEELTEMFNKALEYQGRDIYTKSRLLTFCIRSPVKTVRKVCEQALFSTVQLNIAVEDLKMLKAACSLKGFSCREKTHLDLITSILCNMIDNGDYVHREKPLIISLITRLQKEKLMDINIEIWIMDVIRRELDGKNYDKAEFVLEILRQSVKLRLFRSNEAVLLVFFSQLLNCTLWSNATFSVSLVKIREDVISCISLIMRNSNFSATEKELFWLRNELMKCSEINRLYFCDLWYSYGCDLDTSSDLYIQIFTLIHTKTKVQQLISLIVNNYRSEKLLGLRISLTAAFIQILPILTGREWTVLLTHLKTIVTAWLEFQEEKAEIDVSVVIFRIFTMSLYCLAQDMNENKDMMSCFSHCIRNFGKMVQQNFLACTDLKYEIAVVFMEELLFLLNGIQDVELRQENSITLTPVVVEIGNRGRNNATEGGTELEELEHWYKKDFIPQVPN